MRSFMIGLLALTLVLVLVAAFALLLVSIPNILDDITDALQRLSERRNRRIK